jgi:large subunit ribosomal protein L20
MARVKRGVVAGRRHKKILKKAKGYFNARGMTYSTLINGLSKSELAIDRKVLADLAMHDMPAFTAIAEKAKASLAA